MEPRLIGVARRIVCAYVPRVMFLRVVPLLCRPAVVVLHLCRALVAGLVLVVAQSCLAAPPLRGNAYTHDPSTVIKCKDRYYFFGTGQGITVRSSSDKIYWRDEATVFASPPEWTSIAVPGFTGIFWAPDIVLIGGQYCLYYAVSTWGSPVSAIGLATNPTLDPTDPAYHWTDRGAVIQSNGSSGYNVIDPSVLRDTNGKLWLTFGSYFNGIYLMQLNPATGQRISPGSPLTRLAENGSIEASCLFQRGAYYYLFVNFGSCCSGVDSTYNIRVGRSTSATGPYRGRDGVDMVSGGGSLFLESTGKFVGPGHVGILPENGRTWFGYHHYDADLGGAPTFDFRPLDWTADGWPTFTNDWSARYRFTADARDDNGGDYGLLKNGAKVASDPVHGAALALDGTTNYVELPAGPGFARTYAAVVKWEGGGTWQRIFDFGQGTGRYVFLSPSSNTGHPRFAITTSGGGGEQILEGPTALPAGVWTHLAVTLDGSRSVLYVNGRAAATNSAMTLLPWNVKPTTNYLGRSRYPADPYFKGRIAAFRSYGRTLSATEIVQPVPHIDQPGANTFFRPGSVIPFSGGAEDFAANPLATALLTWRVEWADDLQTNLVFGPARGLDGGGFTVPTSGLAATSGVYRVFLDAIDTVGRGGRQTVEVYPSPGTSLPTTNWTSTYSFDSGGRDDSGFMDATLSGATTTTLPVRGSVLDLSGAGQYVRLSSAAGTMRTFAAWVKWNGGGAWQRVFDIGTDTTRYAFLTPWSNNGVLRFGLTAPNAGGERTLEAPFPLPVGVWTHVAVVLDGDQAVMFINGRAIASLQSLKLLPIDTAATAAYLGRSFWPDPYFAGQMDSVLLSSRALPIQDIMASALKVVPKGSSIDLAWPAWASGPALFQTPDLSPPTGWTQIATPPAVTNGMNRLTLPSSAERRFFQLRLP